MPSLLAKQYHSITIGDKNTWDDWHLIPTSRPRFSPPEANIMLVDVPGANGSLNLSKVMTGYTTYKNRTGGFEFIVHPDFVGYDKNREAGVHYWHSWSEAYHTIMAYLHGEERHAILNDDPTYYYDCVWTVNEWNSGTKWSTITLNYSAQPFKKSVQNMKEPWLWDPFSFVDGYINDFQEIGPGSTGTDVKPFIPLFINESLELHLVCGDEPVIPVFNMGSIVQDMTVSLNNGTAYPLVENSSNKFRKIKMVGPTNTLRFTGSGTLNDIDYVAGWF